MPNSRPASPPLIGVSTYVERARWGAWDLPSALVPYAYVDAVSAAGGRPLLVPPTPDGAEATVDALDGLVLAGGADLDPSLYGQRCHAATTGIRPDRDSGELTLVRVALTRELPLLAICRGVELLNIALGGELVQHLPDELGGDTHRGAPGQFVQHDVRIEPTAPVARRITGTTSVYSYHHQGLGRLAKALEPFAWAPDGIVEAVQHRGMPFAVGVLWHPEAGSDIRLFDALVEAARRYRKDRGAVAPEMEEIGESSNLGRRGTGEWSPSKKGATGGYLGA